MITMSVERERRRGYRGGVKLYLGLLIVIFYAALGTYSMFAGYRTSVGLEWEADALAQPAWVALLLDPEIPRTVEASLSGWQLFQGGLERSRLIEGNGIVSIVIQTPGSVSLVSEYIDYPYKPARSMVITYGFKVFSEGSAKYRIQLYLVSDKLLGREKVVEQGGVREKIKAGIYMVFRADDTLPSGGNRSFVSSIRLPYPYLNRIQDPPIPIFVNPVSELLLEPGTRLRAMINISYECLGDSCRGVTIQVEPVGIKILGRAHGLMGTDSRGIDIWRQFIEGARVANFFGLTASLLTVGIAVTIGSIAGLRAGRFSDQVITLLTDMIFFIPAVPLIMITVALLGRSMPVIYGIIVLVSWPGLARLVRSWAITIRSEPYVESAVALGAGKLWILRRHIMPRLAPLAIYGLVSLVPGVIATEILIQFIGFGDPNIPSWGRMLNEAYNEGALVNGAWWWLFAPIAGITSYMAGFVLIGMALEERLNPKLLISR